MTRVEAPGSCEVTLADNTIGEEEIAAVTAVLRSRWLSAGEVTRAFEREFADALGCDGAVAVSSGTAALHLAVLALGLEPGDEVIVPSLNFVAGAAVTALRGAVPVFADIRSADDLTVPAAEVERLISDRTRAVMVMHYGGYPAAAGEVTELARARGIAVIEDAAHAPVVRHAGRALGTIGDVGCFSFYATKNVTTGEGGMVVARDAAALSAIRSMRSHCMSRSAWDRMRETDPGYDVTGIGLNYRPTEIMSAIGRVQLSRLAADRSARRRLVRQYARELADVPGTTVPFRTYGGDCAYHLMPVLLPPAVPRDRVQAAMRARGVQTSVHYPPIHRLSEYREGRPGQVTRREHLPVTEDVAPRLLSLPLHSRMTGDDVTATVASLKAALEAS